VDDGSRDESGAILDEYARADSRFVVIRQENAGVSAARNAALDIACGDYISFLDADDVVAPDWLQVFYSLISRYGADLIRTGFLEWEDGGNLPVCREGCESGHEFKNPDAVLKWGVKELAKNGYVWLNAIRRSVISGCRFPEGMKIQEDNLFLLSVLSHIRSVVISDYAGYFYRKGRPGASRQWRENHLFDCRLRVLQELVCTFRKVHPVYEEMSLGEESRTCYADLVRSQLWLIVSELYKAHVSVSSRPALFEAIADARSCALLDFSCYSWVWRLPWFLFVSMKFEMPLRLRMAVDRWRERRVGDEKKDNMQIKVLTVGVFDLLHFGHFELFRRARELAGDDGALTVAIQDDDVVTKYKPQAKLVYDWETRAKMIRTLRTVDNVVHYRDIDESIKDIDFDIWAIGGDQTHAGFQRAVAWAEAHGKKVVRLTRTDGISSSQIRAGGMG